MSSVAAGFREVLDFFRQNKRSQIIGWLMGLSLGTAFVGGMLVGMIAAILISHG